MNIKLALCVGRVLDHELISEPELAGLEAKGSARVLHEQLIGSRQHLLERRHCAGCDIRGGVGVVTLRLPRLALRCGNDPVARVEAQGLHMDDLS